MKREVLQTAEVIISHAKTHAEAKQIAEEMLANNGIIWNKIPLVIYPNKAKLWKPKRAKKKARR